MSSNVTRGDNFYQPRLAWLRALAFFAICLVAAWFAGVTPFLLREPLADTKQTGDALWWLATLSVTAYVLFAYLYFWPKGTTHQGRALHVPVVLVFGLLWGLAQGQLALVVFGWIEQLGLGRAWDVVIMFGIYANLTAVWHSRYWDVHVAPDHNIYEWNLKKVLVVHTPFLLLAVTHLAIYGNATIFVAWHVIALTAAAWVMRFPAPWDANAPAHDGKGVRMQNVLESANRS